MKISFISILIILSCKFCYSQNRILNNKDYTEMIRFASGKFKRNNQECVVYDGSYFVVIFVTDMKTNNTKEICTQFERIEGAIKLDKSKSSFEIGSRILKLYSDSALRYIGYHDFDSLRLIECTSGLSSKQLQMEWHTNSLNFSKKYSDYCEVYIAYLLFKQGIITRISDAVIGLFEIVEGNELNSAKKRRM